MLILAFEVIMQPLVHVLFNAVFYFHFYPTVNYTKKLKIKIISYTDCWLPYFIYFVNKQVFFPHSGHLPLLNYGIVSTFCYKILDEQSRKI